MLHDLIGLSGNLGCDALCDVSRQLLEEVHQGRMDTLPQFMDMFGRTIAEVQAFVDANAQTDRTMRESAGAAQLLRLCKDYDFAAVEWMERHGDSLRRQMPPAAFAQLAAAVECCDFERACKLLEP